MKTILLFILSVNLYSMPSYLSNKTSFLKRCMTKDWSITKNIHTLKMLKNSYLSRVFKEKGDIYENTKDLVSLKFKNINQYDVIYNTSIFNNNDFIMDLEDVSGFRFSINNSLKFLVDGPASFKYRDKLISTAKKEILVMVWAIYNDKTGCETAWNLILKHRQNVDVKIIVDGANGDTSFRVPVKLLSQAGIPVIKWYNQNDFRKSLHGMHNKLLIIDGKYLIAGGMNFGDHYSHKNINASKWRDTDVLIEGTSVSKARDIFVDMWNKYLNNNNPSFRNHKIIYKDSMFYLMNKTEIKIDVTSIKKLSVITHNPSNNNADPILLATLKSIYAARKTIEISNAYFIMVDILKEALIEAANRGVRVKIHTNSMESIDVSSLVAPMYDGLRELCNSNERIEIYLRQSSTLHSKYLVVDSIFGWVGSYNLHPRSHYFESESVVIFIDEDYGKQLHNIFVKDSKGESKRVINCFQLERAKDFKYDILSYPIPEVL